MKLANGSGSIVCLDPTGKKRRKPWTVRITTGWKDGKQVRKYLGYYATQSEALIALSGYLQNGYDIDLSKLTLNEVFDMWIKRVEKKNLSPAVIRTHNVARSRFDKLGNLPINKIKAVQLQDWLDNLDLKPATKGKVKSTVNQVFKYALSNDIVTRNYAESLEINEKVEKTGSIFTSEEINKLWELSHIDEARQLLIMIYTGMRIGELLDVKRENIHFDEYYIIGGSKTEAGRDRVIPIHKEIMPLIVEQLGDNNWLIQSPRGNQPVKYNTLKLRFDTFLKDLKMSHKPHDCRKTAISLMHTYKVPIEIIRIIVGHSGKGVTEQVYLFKTPQELVEEINKIEIKR